ncbi:MAG: hypothetical protein CVV25_00960 [Ignavibacteriae bacterium HGW-Ignavibacteriae-4]|jgi:hypothetical protein|nr:MAG: hypothetical protein CVV25_00960 [Ignavibacteriae bacterium HGW-Ignavibacteriae-4]
MNTFNAEIKIIGINPYVSVPSEILEELYIRNGKINGPIKIKGKVNGNVYQQTLVKYSGEWRLYINNKMLKNSPQLIGETIEISVEYDSSDRTIVLHPNLIKALNNNLLAKEKFNSIPSYLQKEIVRYISNLKTESSIDRNVIKAINFLNGKDSFIGRKPLE